MPDGVPEYETAPVLKVEVVSLSLATCLPIPPPV